MEKRRDIGSKFAVSTDGQIYKKSNEEIVPEDEPLFLLRGRDALAITLLLEYFEISRQTGCGDYHNLNLVEAIKTFFKFESEYPERMKTPGITDSKSYKKS